MGLSLTSIHIYGDSVPADCGFNFRSFSENWFTCIDPLPCEEMKNTYAMARTLSKKTSATVLWFYLFDSDMIWMTFFKDGKIAEMGTHRELMERRGYYHTLYTKQFERESVDAVK